MEAALGPTLLGQAVGESASHKRHQKTGIDSRNTAQPVRVMPNLDREVPPSMELMAAQIVGSGRVLLELLDHPV
jgi:hypothetical protein